MIAELAQAKDVSKFGGKAVNLGSLLRAGLPVPDGFAVGLESFDSKGKLKTEAKEEIKELLKGNKLYAVRSSAIAEDAEGESWAGQFETFLNTTAEDVINKVEECHNSTKDRAKAYSGKKEGFDIAVVVQEMVDAEIAGVTFTRDPSSGAKNIITEYVEGLGEALVHGDADPERVVWSRTSKKVKEQTEKVLPFPLKGLIELGEKVEASFENIPQDIEWTYAEGKIWLVQSRPITTLQDRGEGKHYLGDPGGLFYWGPSRALPLFMSDFMLATEDLFSSTTKDPSLPDAPKTIVLFHTGQMVWLNKEAEFGKFVSEMFKAYEKAQRFQDDYHAWQVAAGELDKYFENKEIDISTAQELFKSAWGHTLVAEFSLYGAETVLIERLSRFSEKDRQEIWGIMTLPDQPTFMQQLDVELSKTANPAAMAKKYPWIEDGYSGVFNDAASYFTKRLKTVKDDIILHSSSAEKRSSVAEEHDLKPNEVSALDLARELSVFMDERKAWMMRTRGYIKKIAEAAQETLGLTVEEINHTTLERLASGKSEPYFGWSFLKGTSVMLTKEDVNLAWDWYVEFRASKAVLKGLVASSGGRHFINGEVFVAQTPQDAMPSDAVLVVPSTSPSYVPLMRNARALITDHGGMMSHAAIVAREFGLPCIVGTKQATKVLKDGDKVVLDLVKGEVNR